MLVAISLLMAVVGVHTNLVSADPPGQPALVSPSDGATDVAIDAELAVDVAHASGEDLEVTFYGRAKDAGEPFTVVLLPDTQNYTTPSGAMGPFTAQTNWILAEQDQRNTAAVVHLGDIVDTGGNATHWTRAMSALDPLKRDDLPLAIMPGNHDYDSVQVDPLGPPNGMPAANYDLNFPVAPNPSSLQQFGYAGGYMGDPTDAVTADQDGNYANRGWKNNYVLFEAAGNEFIIVSIEYNFPDETKQWLDAVLAQFPDRRAIINTHQWLEANGQISTDGPSGGAAAAWNLVRNRCNVFLILNGHNVGASGGEARRTEQNVCGDTVYMHLSDYQNRANGGDGWLRILTFDPGADQILVETYSPSLQQFETDANSRFTEGYSMVAEPPWVPLGSTTVAGGIGRAEMDWEGLQHATEYEWYVEVGHGGSSTDNGHAPWSFTTMSVPPPGDTVVASDAFERVTTNGWSTAPIGGTWALNGAVANFSVNAGRGNIRMNTAGAGPSASLPAVSSTNTNTSLQITLDKPATGAGTYVSVLGRRVASTADYRIRLRYMSNGTVQAALARLAGGTQTDLATINPVPGVNGNQTVNVRLHVEGTSPTQLRAKVWPTGTPEPTNWLLTATDSTAALQAAGGIGVITVLSSSSTNAPVTASFDNLTATTPG